MSEINLQPEIKERFLQLPTEVQTIILESGWQNVTRRIVEQNNLRIDQGAAIENEVMLTMFGFENPNNFKQNIIKEARVDSETADKIVSSVDSQIFSLIKEKLIMETVGDEADFEKISPDYTNKNITSSELTGAERIESREEIISAIEKTDEEPKINIIDEALEKPQISTPIKIDPYKEPLI